MFVAGLFVVSAPQAQAVVVFQPAVSYSPVALPISPEIADINGDGYPDILTGSGGDNVGVMVNNGDGTFTVTDGGEVACTGAGDIAVGNVNFLTDDDPDIVAACQDGQPRSLLGESGAAFADPIDTGFGGVNGNLVLGQFGHESSLGEGDLLFTQSVPDGDPLSGLCIAAATGFGSYDYKGCEESGTPVGGEIVGIDFNADGQDRPVAIGTENNVLMYAFEIDKVGGLSQPAARLTNSTGTANSLSQGDLDEDGIPDFIVLNSGHTGQPSFSVFLATALGIPAEYDAPTVSTGDITAPVDSAIGDFDGDGHQDVAVMQNASLDTPGGVLGIYPGNGDGTFDDGQFFTAGVNGDTHNIRAADLDLNGSDDIAISIYPSGSGSVQVLLSGAPAPDTIAPDTTITSGPKTKIKTRKRKVNVSFAFSSSETPSTFECDLDGAGFVPCTSPQRYTVKRGSHLFQVRATDDADNTDPTPATYPFKVVRRR